MHKLINKTEQQFQTDMLTVTTIRRRIENDKNKTNLQIHVSGR